MRWIIGLLCISSQAAILIVGSPGYVHNAASPISCPSFNVVSGNALVVAVETGFGSSGSPETITVSDTASTNTFTSTAIQYGSAGGGNGGATQFFYTLNAVAISGDVITATFSPANQGTMQCYQVSGLGTTAGSVDVDAGAALAASTTFTTNSFSTAVANEIAIVAFCNGNGTSLSTWVAGSGYTLATPASNGPGQSEYQIFSTTQSGVTASITSTANVAGSYRIITLKQAGDSDTSFFSPDPQIGVFDHFMGIVSFRKRLDYVRALLRGLPLRGALAWVLSLELSEIFESEEVLV